MTRFRLFGALSVLMILCDSAAAADWPHWRGPERNDRVSAESGWTGDRWISEQPLWTAGVGEGSGSPLVVGSRLFSFTWKDGQEVLSALQVDTGKPLWSVSYPAAKYGRHAVGDQGLYSGPSSTPEYDTVTGWLYTLGSDGSLRAWDVSSESSHEQPRNIWAVELYDRYKAERRPKVGRSSQRDYGYTSSPLVLGDVVIVEVGAAGGTLMAFDRRTGAERWKSRVCEPAGHNGGPVPLIVDGVACVAVHHFNGLLVVRTDSGYEGETVAEVPWQTEYANNIATVAVHGSSVLLTSNYNQSRMARFDLSLTAGARQVWESRESSKVCSPLIHGGCVYWAWQQVICLDFQTGQLRWKGGRIGDPGSCVMTSDDRLVVWSGRGELSLVDSAVHSPDQYSERARMNLGRDDAWPHVVIAGERVFCKDRQGRLVCVSLRKTAETAAPKMVAEQRPSPETTGKTAIQQGWILSASHHPKDVGRAMDGDSGSRWSSDTDQAPGLWFSIDLKKKLAVTGLKLETQGSPEDYPRAFEIRTSEDGRTWSAPIVRGKGSGPQTEIPLPAGTKTQHLRITLTDSVPKWWSIHELTVQTHQAETSR
ncbi:MAG: PQQ-binding-like beta-propeller repeat protein [Planctomycetaceae bacterium]